jgi:hypothetical protein
VEVKHFAAWSAANPPGKISTPHYLPFEDNNYFDGSFQKTCPADYISYRPCLSSKDRSNFFSVQPPNQKFD